MANDSDVQPLDRAEGYDRVSRVLHWTVAFLMIAVVALGLMLDNWPRNHPTREAVIMVHKSFGLIILALAVLRLSWRLRTPAPLPAARLAVWERRASSVIHKLLYFLIFALPLSGMLLSQAAGKQISFFGLFAIPQIVPFDPAIPVANSRWVIAGVLLHTVVFKLALFAAFALHFGGVLKHAFVDRDPSMLRRMWGR